MTDYDPTLLAGTGHHLSPAELRTWTRFLDAGRLLEERLARHLSRDHGMTHAAYEVLVRLDGNGGEMRMTDLARQVVASAQRLTYTANRLEEQGRIARRPVEEDGRGLLAVLLPAGREALAAASGEHAQLIRLFLLDLLDEDEQRVVAESMDRVAGHLRRHRDGVPCLRCEPPGPAAPGPGARGDRDQDAGSATRPR